VPSSNAANRGRYVLIDVNRKAAPSTSCVSAIERRSGLVACRMATIRAHGSGRCGLSLGGKFIAWLFERPARGRRERQARLYPHRHV